MTKYTIITRTEVDVPEIGTPERDIFAKVFASVLEDDEMFIILDFSQAQWNHAFVGMLVDDNAHNMLRDAGIDPSLFIRSYSEEVQV